MMAKEYIEVRVSTSVDAGELLGLLEDSSCLGSCESGRVLLLYWPQDCWDPMVLASLKDALQRLGDASAGETVTVTRLPEQDWNARWAGSLQPVQLGPRVLIRQSWNEASAPGGGFALVIDPRRAFGTGYHVTTQLIVEWLQEMICGGERILDVGTGSGILAMVALRLGARSALAIDNDPEAIECALEYAAVNGFGPELEFRVAAPEDLRPEPFDLVAANLDRRTLLSYGSVFRRYLKPGGCLLVSGLLTEDFPEFRAALESAGWTVRNRRDREEWIALEIRLGAGSQSLETVRTPDRF